MIVRLVNMERINKKGQIWVETVLYTLIGLTLIGIVLAIVTPKINESRDRIVVEQSIESLKIFDEKIKEVSENAVGNTRVISQFELGRGELYIDGDKDMIVLVIKDLRKPFSQPGSEINLGSIKIESQEEQKLNSVNLTLEYANINIQYDKEEVLRKFTSSKIPYSFIVKNANSGSVLIVDIVETSGG